MPDKLSLQQAPRGVDAVVWAASIPSDNALTPERVALGRRLFFEPRLSADGTVACATCHDVTKEMKTLSTWRVMLDRIPRSITMRSLSV